jgi:hypothetical protein
MGLIRLIFFGLIGLSIVYLVVSIYSRSVRREKLEDQWKQDNSGSQDVAAHDAFVDKGMSQYNAGIRPKLILLVYVVPTIVVAVIHVLTTYY